MTTTYKGDLPNRRFDLNNSVSNRVLLKEIELHFTLQFVGFARVPPDSTPPRDGRAAWSALIACRVRPEVYPNDGLHPSEANTFPTSSTLAKTSP